MSRPTTTGTGRMLHCSPDRTLFVTASGIERLWEISQPLLGRGARSRRSTRSSPFLSHFTPT